jgi:hypothetical protein
MAAPARRTSPQTTTTIYSHRRRADHRHATTGPSTISYSALHLFFQLFSPLVTSTNSVVSTGTIEPSRSHSLGEKTSDPRHTSCVSQSLPVSQSSPSKFATHTDNKREKERDKGRERAAAAVRCPVSEHCFAFVCTSVETHHRYHHRTIVALLAQSI